MDFERNHTGQHTKEILWPKLILAGSVQVTVSGRPFVVDFSGNRIVLRLADFRTAWSLRNTVRPNAETLLRVLSFLKIEIHGQIASLPETRIFPNPGILLRLIMPKSLRPQVT